MGRAVVALLSVVLCLPGAAAAEPRCNQDLVELAIEVGSRELDRKLETGAVGDHLTEQFVRSACRVEQARRWLPRTCGDPKSRIEGVPDLRRRLIADATSLASKAAARGTPRVSTELVALVGVIEAARAGGDPRVLAELLAETRQTAVACRAQVGSIHQAMTEMLSKPEMRRLAVILQAVIEMPSPAPEDAVEAISVALQEAGLPSLPVDARIQQQLQEAVALAARLKAEAEQARAVGPQEASRRLVTAVTGLTALVAMAWGLSETQAGPKVVGVLLQPFDDRRLRDPVALAQELVRRLGETDALPEAVGAATERGLALVGATRPEDARQALRRFFVPMWDERFLFDFNAGMPILESGRIRASGDLLFGYHGPQWGVALRGGAGWYDEVNDDRISETIRGQGDIEGWWVSKGSRAWRLELRAEAEGGVLDTSTLDLAGVTGSLLAEETSIVVRGQGLIGARYEPRNRVAMLLSAGAGGQYENYYAVDVAQSGDGFGNVDNDTGSITAQARWRLQVQLVPKWLVMRARVDLLYYQLSRLQRALFAGMGSVDITESTARGHQVQLESRLFLDFEGLRFGGFVPAVHGGSDLLHLELPREPARTAPVGVVGIGVRRVAF